MTFFSTQPRLFTAGRWLALTSLLVGASFLAAHLSAERKEPAASPLAGARQLLLVVTGTWDAVNGTMRRFERASDANAWKPVGAEISIVVGRNGLGWGRGLVTAQGEGPVKREGDGKSPAGVFRLSTAFGQSKEPPSGWRLPYRFLGDDVECVDDAQSGHYNQLATRSGGLADWSSSEKMWLEPDYRWGVEVMQNAPAPLPNAGSCIFLHIWRGPDHPTAGCTAMDEGALTTTIAWIDPARRPLLVQLPRGDYERLKAVWGLP